MYFVSSSLPALFFFFSEGWGMVSPFRCCLPAKESEKALSFSFFFFSEDMLHSPLSLFFFSLSFFFSDVGFS